MLYFIFQTLHPISELGSWESRLPGFTHVIGYSGLGHTFLVNEKTGEYAVLFPFRQAYKNYGKFASAADFETKILKEEGFLEYVLAPSHQADIQKHVGPLKQGEVYIPNPYPFFGGSEEPDTYSKGDFWVFMDIVGQSWD